MEMLTGFVLVILPGLMTWNHLYKLRNEQRDQTKRILEAINRQTETLDARLADLADALYYANNGDAHSSDTPDADTPPEGC